MKELNQIIASKTISSKEVFNLIPEGANVVISHAAGAPQLFFKDLFNHYETLKNVKAFHLIALANAPYDDLKLQGHLRHVAGFVGANSRKAVNEDLADFIPCFFYEVPIMMKKGLLPVDVSIIQVSEPNEEGYCSFGVSCDYTKPSTECAKIVIAEMNKKMPFIGGNNFIHISKIDYIVPADYDLPEIPLPKIGEVEKAIGRHCASLIPDGATLQLGIGAIPDAVLLFLKEKKDLGIHTEMFSDGVLELVKAGVITGKYKTIAPGKMTATFLMGSKKLYDFVHNNSDVELAPVDYVNHPATIMQIENMISINSCIEVDLMGQVVSECIGKTQFSGTGGQVDYVRGTSMSKSGISIMAMPSTAKKGTASRIVIRPAEGAAITTLRTDVDYVVTEYGIAHLKGKNLYQRAKALVAIAHPDFRVELDNEIRTRFPNH